MCAYLSRMAHKFSLFDAPLVYNFSQISTTEDADLRKVFDNTLVRSVFVPKVDPYSHTELGSSRAVQRSSKLKQRHGHF